MRRPWSVALPWLPAVLPRLCSIAAEGSASAIHSHSFINTAARNESTSACALRSTARKACPCGHKSVQVPSATVSSRYAGAQLRMEASALTQRALVLPRGCCGRSRAQTSARYGGSRQQSLGRVPSGSLSLNANRHFEQQLYLGGRAPRHGGKANPFACLALEGGDGSGGGAGNSGGGGGEGWDDEEEDFFDDEQDDYLLTVGKARFLV